MRIAVVEPTSVIVAMVELLADHGRGEHTLAIYSRLPAHIGWARELGAEVCSSHVAAARGAHIILLGVEPRDVRAALFGVGQAVAEVAAPRAVIIDFSGTGDSLGGELVRYGKLYLAATLEGDEAAVREGRLRITLCGVYGAVEIAVPVLERITSRLIHHEP